MASLFRTVLTFVVGGTLLGIIGASYFSPRYLAWDNTPGQGKALCDCAEITRQSADRLINAQLTGGAVGGGVGLLVGSTFLFLRRKKRLALSSPAPTSAP